MPSLLNLEKRRYPLEKKKKGERYPTDKKVKERIDRLTDKQLYCQKKSKESKQLYYRKLFNKFNLIKKRTKDKLLIFEKLILTFVYDSKSYMENLLLNLHC